jgi:hypothetical protein
MVELVWDPIVATAAILLGSLVAYIILMIGHKITKPRLTTEKLKTYACGEEAKPGEAHMDSEQFFSPIRRIFRPFYRYIQPAHTGVLSTYLLWVIVGFIIIVIIIILTVR